MMFLKVFVIFGFLSIGNFALFKEFGELITIRSGRSVQNSFDQEGEGSGEEPVLQVTTTTVSSVKGIPSFIPKLAKPSQSLVEEKFYRRKQTPITDYNDLLPATSENFDLKKFMGRWYEGINSPRVIEHRCVVHHYGGLTNNDKTATFTALKIYREGSEFGTVRYTIGIAFRDGNKGSMLQLDSSESEDVQPFWVYKLGPESVDPFGNKQYEYAVVSNWVKFPVTVLVRDPDTFKQKYEPEVLRWLEDQGFVNGFVRAFDMLQPTSYNQCQYADSIFEIFSSL